MGGGGGGGGDLLSILVCADEPKGVADDPAGANGDRGAERGEQRRGDERRAERRPEGVPTPAHAEQLEERELVGGAHHGHLASVGAAEPTCEEERREQRAELDRED